MTQKLTRRRFLLAAGATALSSGAAMAQDQQARTIIRMFPVCNSKGQAALSGFQIITEPLSKADETIIAEELDKRSLDLQSKVQAAFESNNEPQAYTAAKEDLETFLSDIMSDAADRIGREFKLSYESISKPDPSLNRVCPKPA